MIVELVKMKSITGSPIQTKPSFNVMIGECYVCSSVCLEGPGCPQSGSPGLRSPIRLHSRELTLRSSLPPTAGPSAEVLINQGARFAGCMKYIPDVSMIETEAGTSSWC